MALKPKTAKQVKQTEPTEILSVVVKAEEKRKLMLFLNANGWEGTLAEYARRAIAAQLQADGATFTVSSLTR